MLVIEDSEKAILVNIKKLEQVIYILYPIAFPGGITKDGSGLNPVLVLFDSSSEINTIHLIFIEKFGFLMQTTNVGAQKINGITLETFEIVVAAFLVTNQANRIRFFEETFLVANISPDVVLRMLFFTLSDIDIDFLKREL